MLEDLQKNLEKQIIRLFVASASHTTSELRKEMTQKTLQQAKQTIEQNTTQYTKQLGETAKGKWVDSAKQTTQRTSNRLDWLA